ALLKDQASHHFWNCYRLGVSYNELCQILGREQTEALIEDDPRLGSTELVRYGKIVESFGAAPTITYGIDKLFHFMKYAELNGMSLGKDDPGSIEISVI